MPLPVTMDVTTDHRTYRRSAERVVITGTERPWIYASGRRGIKKLEVQLNSFPAVVSLPCQTTPEINGPLTDACWDGNTAASATQADATPEVPLG